jgi:hypothetical protein
MRISMNEPFEQRLQRIPKPPSSSQQQAAMAAAGN